VLAGAWALWLARMAGKGASELLSWQVDDYGDITSSRLRHVVNTRVPR
jgi:hypothetical protein